MADQWPPKAADVRGHFKNAQDGAKSPPPPAKIVTAAEIEKLQKQHTKAVPVLKPAGAKANDVAERERQRRIKAMKERLAAKEGKAQKDFKRVNERGH